MIFKMRFKCQTLVVLCYAVLTTADRRNNDLTKLLSLSSASNSDGSAVVNVTSASIVIPSSYSGAAYASARTSRSAPEFQKYAFRPRALNTDPKEKPVYYAKDNLNNYKSEILFPGNYFGIAKEKSDEDLTKDAAFSGRFQPQAIPLLTDQGFEGRSLDDDEEEIEKPEEFTESSVLRRSLSYIFGGGEEEAEEEEDGEYEIEDEDETDSELKSKRKRKKNKNKLKHKKRYSKYMLPLLLAYKLKYLAIVPVLIGGLTLLVGATGLAGFFFALFAATMALQKGGY